MAVASSSPPIPEPSPFSAQPVVTNTKVPLPSPGTEVAGATAVGLASEKPIGTAVAPFPVTFSAAPGMSPMCAAPAAPPVSNATTTVVLSNTHGDQQGVPIFTTVAASLAHSGAAPFILVPTSLFGGAAAIAANANAFQIPLHALSHPLALASSTTATVGTTTTSTTTATTTASGAALVAGGDQVMTLVPCFVAPSTSSASQVPNEAPTSSLTPTSLAFSAALAPGVAPANLGNSTQTWSAHASPVSTPPGSPLLMAPPAASVPEPTSLSVPHRRPRPDDGDAQDGASPKTPPKLKRQRTRKTYSFTEKAQALDQLAAIRATDPTISVERASRQVRINGLPIPDSTLHSWIADESAIRKAASETAKSTVRRCAGTILGTLLEEAIAEWAKGEVEAVAVSKPTGNPAPPATCPGLKIQQCARMVAKKKAEKLKALGRPVSALLDAFCGSDGWLDRFKTRWGIKWNGTVASASAMPGGNAKSATSVARWIGGLGGDGWTDQKWDAVIDRVIAIEGGTASQADDTPVDVGSALATQPDALAPAAAMDPVTVAADKAQAIPPVNCIMPSSSSSFALDSDSAGEDALSFLLNYSGPESTASTADICDCGTVSAPVRTTASPLDAQSGLSRQPNPLAADLEELALTPPALDTSLSATATFSAPQPLSTFSWLAAGGADGLQPGTSSTMTPIPLQQLLSIPLLPNEPASAPQASNAPSCFSFHSLPQFQPQQAQGQEPYASSTAPCLTPSSSPFALAPQAAPQLFSSPPASPSGAFSAVNTFHGLHAHYCGVQEWDATILEAARDILARKGEWVSSEEGGASDPHRCG